MVDRVLAVKVKVALPLSVLISEVPPLFFFLELLLMRLGLLAFEDTCRDLRRLFSLLCFFELSLQESCLLGELFKSDPDVSLAHLVKILLLWTNQSLANQSLGTRPVARRFLGKAGLITLRLSSKRVSIVLIFKCRLFFCRLKFSALLRC